MKQKARICTLMGMKFTLQFDKPIPKERALVSPGGYEINMDGECIQFDFTHYAGEIDQDDPKRLYVEVFNYDDRTFPDMYKITIDKLNSIAKNLSFEEFYVDIDKAYEGNVVKVTALSLDFGSEGWFDWPEVEFTI